MGARLAIIVLTKDEEANLPALLDSVRALDAEIWVVDSGSGDATVAIARAAGCRVVEHPFENYAAQRNWAFANLPVDAPWTLSLDADERLTPELVAELRDLLAGPEPAFAGYMLRKRTVFMGRWLRHGGQYPAWHLRLARTGRVRCEDRLYDQHFVVDGPVGRLRHDYVDVLTADLTSWIARHNRWASLEAEEILRQQREGATARGQVAARFFGSPIERRRFLRHRVYQRFPLFVRPFLFWIYGYVLRLGFLDGVPGLVFHTLQRFWFRFLVDAKIYEMRRRADRT